MLARRVINQLQRDRRFKGTCPGCAEDFFLADALMYSIDEEPPEAVLRIIKVEREVIKDRKKELEAEYELMTTRCERTTTAVNIGKIVEKIVPSFTSFSHNPCDCRALFDPIDYVIFSGLGSRGQVDSLTFLDVKSGNARLTGGQRAIKGAVQRGSVNFEVITDAGTR